MQGCRDFIKVCNKKASWRKIQKIKQREEQTEEGQAETRRGG